MSKEKEKVLCLPFERLHPYSLLEGFCLWDPSIGEVIIDTIKDEGRFCRRGDVEDDPDFKQIIPQILLVAENKVLVHRTPETAGEARLIGTWPIFLGGHMNEADGTDPMAAALREFKEELNYPFPVTASSIGFVNLNDTDVNKAHFGLVYVFHGERAELPHGPTPAAIDEGVSDASFMTWEELAGSSKKLNGWSQVALHLLRERYDRE